MVQEKRKETIENSSKRKSVVQNAEASGNQLTPSELTKFWQKEIETLQRANVKTVDQAVDMLIELVVTKLSVGADLEHTKEFLKVMFDTDKTLKGSLEKLVGL